MTDLLYLRITETFQEQPLAMPAVRLINRDLLVVMTDIMSISQLSTTSHYLAIRIRQARFTMTRHLQ